MRKSIIIEQEYPYSPEEVWDALTDQEQISEWLMNGTFQPRVGHEFELYWSGKDGSKGMTKGKVMEIVKPRKLSYTWNWGTDGTLVTFYLDATNTGTKLRLEHTGFVEGQDEQVFQGASQGWNSKLGNLGTLLSKREKAIA
jgi:uncharacterized protein YndB with AHSA1/START domain